MKFNLKKKLVVTATALMLAIGATGCGSTNTDKQAQSKKEASVVYGISTSPTGIFNPLLTDSVYDDAVCQVVYTSLLELDNEQNLKPYLAEKYEVSKDEKEITFHLNKDLKWSDGKLLTANDVKFTFYSLANKDYQGELGNYVSNVKGVEEYKAGKTDKIEGIKVVDDSTIKVQLDKPFGPAVTNLGTVGIIPEHIWSKVPENKWKESKELLTKPVGNGPFKLTAFEEGKNVKFVRNDTYFKSKAKSDNLIFKIVNEDTVLSDLKNGDIDACDVTNLKKKDIEELKKDNFKVYTHANNLFQYMGLNYRKDVFKNKLVREAIITAIDRNGMVDKLIEGNGEVKLAPMLSSSWAYPKDSKLNEYKYDVAKAKSLLEQAGYKEVNGIMQNSKGEKLEFTLDVPTGNSIREQAATIIQDNLKKAGIKVTLNKMEFPALMEKVVGNHDFDMYMMGNNLSIDPDLTAYWSKASISDKKGEMGWNISGFTTPELEKLLQDGANTTDRESRKKTYAEFAKYMNEQLPWIYLFEQEIRIATSPKLEGFNPSVFRDFAESENWYIKN